MMKVQHSMIDKMVENDEDRLTDDIEVFKWRKLSSKSDIYKIEREYNERDWIDMTDGKKSYERYQTGERQANEIE